MKVYQTKEIRNIALIGSSRSGKTTLAECMLFEGGVVSRRGSVDDKNTVSDYREIELDRQSSVYSAPMYAQFHNHKINFIDTPGFPDFSGEVIAAQYVTEASLMLINGYNGVEVGTEIAWRTATRNEAPVAFAINHMDHEKANFEDALNQLRDFFGEKVILAQYPVNQGTGFDSVIDLLSMKLLKFPKGGGKYQIADIPAAEASKAEELRAKLVEAAAEGDEELMEKYFETFELSDEEVLKGLRLCLASRSIYPVFCLAAKENQGVQRLMELLITLVSSPDQMPVRKSIDGKVFEYNASGPASLFIYKTSMEPHLGEMSFFKVFSGEITEAMDLINASTGNKERLSQLLVTAGKNREKVEKIVAGDIAATIKLKDSKTNQTLNSPKNADVQVESMSYPDPSYTIAIKAVSSTDDEKVGAVLNELHNIDPTLLVGYSRELRQMIIQGQGETHINMVKWYFDNIHKIETQFLAPRIPYRETITKVAKAMYRHKKQSGGSGQFGEVHMLIQPYSENMPKPTEFPVRGTEEHPLNWGGKLIFNNCIVGGAIDARFMPAILKGIMEKMEEGPLTGSYARDIAVYIYDGKMHPVDSNEISFKLAGRYAFSDAFKNAGPKILEPIYDVEVIVPEERMGDVMTDLQGRRAIIMGMDGMGKYQRIRAKVPLAELNRYSTSLSSITSGRATYTMKFSDYQQVPPDVQNALLKAYEEEQKEEE